MSTAVIFGGAGFIGTHLVKHFLTTGRFTRVHLADIRPANLANTPGVTASVTDVRAPIPNDLVDEPPEWIFNLAAIHREPGHERQEYFKTNLTGARNVCAYAESVGCSNIYFTSSISVYGPTTGPTDESRPIQPTTPYGASKYPAELIHQVWQKGGSGRRLLICRPGVIYGPGDPGNILRMVNAIRKGYFFYPGSPDVFKSYGYIYGLLDSVDFVIDGGFDYLCYNYVETPTQPLKELVSVIKRHLDTRAFVLPMPLWVLLPIARAMQRLRGAKSPIHPVRVRKAGTSTYIVPSRLMELGFQFKYDFGSSLVHWQQIAPEDFGFKAVTADNQRSVRLRLERGGEPSGQPLARREDLSFEASETGETTE